MMTVLKHWHRSPMGVADDPLSLEVFQLRLNRTLSNLM